MILKEKLGNQYAQLVKVHEAKIVELNKLINNIDKLNNVENDIDFHFQLLLI